MCRVCRFLLLVPCGGVERRRGVCGVWELRWERWLGLDGYVYVCIAREDGICKWRWDVVEAL